MSASWTPKLLRGAALVAYDPAAYGDTMGGDAYDALYPSSGLETDATVALLDRLAHERPGQSFVEFGIGTGRIALPLQAKGLRVGGVEASARMVERLRSKPGGNSVAVAVGDYMDTRVPGSFAVAAIVFNNILDLRGRSAQLQIFRNAARHLDEGGAFVVEAFVLNDAQRNGEWSVLPRFVGEDHVELQISRYDISTSRLERTLVHLRPEGTEFVRVVDVYSSPGELDVMAEYAGFTLAERYVDWSGADFTSRSPRHVSVYQRTS